MGAGIVECEVSFTKHGDCVRRHAQNDLHATTDILLTPLAAKCIKPFTPASADASGKRVPASAECPTSELSLQEFKSLRGRMDASNPAARTVPEHVGGTPSWRTDLYTGRGTLMTPRESIELDEKNGVKHTPELKGGDTRRRSTPFAAARTSTRRNSRRSCGTRESGRTMRGRSRST